MSYTTSVDRGVFAFIPYKRGLVFLVAVLLAVALWSIYSDSFFVVKSQNEPDKQNMQNNIAKACPRGLCSLDVNDSLHNTKGLFVLGDSFYLDERPFKIYSGSFHYFRTHPAQWGDRLLRMKAAGLNTIMTYIPWNMHETIREHFNFKGMFDLADFIEQVQKAGLYMIVRPGPFICAEWELGGLPSWLLRDPNMQVRTSSYSPFLSHVSEYFSRLFPLLAKYTYKRDGPIIAFQVENEFGSFSQDNAYLEYLVQQYEKWGLNEILFTSDGGYQLPNGTLTNVLATINFSSDPKIELGVLSEFQPRRPLMVTEFWTGWFDSWGLKHHTSGADKFHQKISTIIQMNASINFYMFIGGTNFGFWNGANYMQDADGYMGSWIAHTVTSYDYDAPIGEAGDIKDKFLVIRKLIQLYGDVDLASLPDVPDNPPKRKYGTVEMTEFMDLNTILSLLPYEPFTYSEPIFMENLPINNNGGQGYGWILYVTDLPQTPYLTISGWLLDRAKVYINGHLCAILSYWDNLGMEFNVTSAKNLATTNNLAILVENMGRINYEKSSFNEPILNTQRKGFRGHARTSDGVTLTNWDHYPLEFNDQFIDILRKYTKWQSLKNITNPKFSKPTIFRGTFTIKGNKLEDTFIDMGNWDKGIVVVNGFHLGRYWRLGPQRTLYVPGPILVEGTNDIIIFDTDMEVNHFTVTLTDRHFIDQSILHIK